MMDVQDTTGSNDQEMREGFYFGGLMFRQPVYHSIRKTRASPTCDVGYKS